MYQATKRDSLLIAFLLVFGMVAIEGYAQNNVIDFSSDRWVMKNAQTSEYLGRTCLAGTAWLKDVEFEDGVIEVDVAVDGKQSYPGIIFRLQSEGNYEHVYIRPHHMGLYPDVLQYAPVNNGVTGWQLYNGYGYTAAATMPTDTWVHLTLEVSGTQARFYVNNSEKPGLVVTDLKRGLGKGTIGLIGPANETAYFSNFQYRIDTTLQLPAAPKPQPVPGIVADWELSPGFKMSQVDREQFPGEQSLKSMTWQTVHSEPSGLVDVSRYVTATGGEPDCVYARAMIVSDTDRTLKMLFGYSDWVTVFLNGQILFSGRSGYRERDPSFAGIIGTYDAAYLRLKKGQNELLLLVTEMFGGWGFMCGDGDAIFQEASLAGLWETPRQFKYPESVVFDDKREVLYVANYYNGNDEFISKVSLDGRIIAPRWVSGIMQPTGMCMYGDKLYVVGRRNLVEIDPETGQISNRFPFPSPQFPNDVTVSSTGDFYITDSGNNSIYRCSGGSCQVWLQSSELAGANAIICHQDKLLVGCSGDATVRSYALVDKTMMVLTTLTPGVIIDGLAPDGAGGYLLSDNNGHLYRLDPSGEKTELLNTSVPNISCADFAFIPDKNLIVMPTFYDNRLVGYRYLPKR